MKVYLINPPANNGIQMIREGRCMQRKGAWTTIWPPVTLATMAAMLLKERIDVKLNDCIVENIGFEELKEKISEFQPDLLVINTATASINSDLSCAKLAKEAFAKTKTLAFGLHVSALPEEAFKLAPCLDYCIRGEVEFCLLELARQIRDGSAKFEEIRGLSFRSGSRVQHNPERNFENDLSQLPFPAWELIDPANYRLPLSGEPFLLVTTSKGCPHSCIFCPAKPFYGNRLRLRKYDTVADEIEHVRKNLGVRQFLIWSESFTEDRDFVVKLCQEIIRRKLDVSWVCNSRVDKVDWDLLKIMKEAGCWMIGFGIETGDQGILDSAGKGTTVSQVEGAVGLAKKAGLEVTAHVIFGLPGETLETGKKTIRWLNKLKIDYVQVYCAVPWPSSPLYKLAQKKGWLISDNWEKYEQNEYVMDTGNISPGQVKHLRKKAIITFYLSGGRPLAMIKKINSLKKIKNMFAMLKEFASWI